jgi:signal recognition particle GTPase
MIIGTPGSGKTTTIAKLANLEQKNNKKALRCVTESYYTAEGYRIKT